MLPRHAASTLVAGCAPSLPADGDAARQRQATYSGTATRGAAKARSRSRSRTRSTTAPGCRPRTRQRLRLRLATAGRAGADGGAGGIGTVTGTIPAARGGPAHRRRRQGLRCDLRDGYGRGGGVCRDDAGANTTCRSGRPLKDNRAMSHNSFDTLQNFKPAPAKPASSTRCPRSTRPASARSRACRSRSASCSRACCATATARRSPRSTCAQLANWEPNARAHRRDPVHRRAHRAAGLHRRAAARRPGRDAQRRPREIGKNPKTIEPLVPVDLVVDHSVQVDYYGAPDALDLNMKLEFSRNRERYQFLKWGMQAFDTFKVVPPGHRHRAPGEPRVPGARRAPEGRRRTTRTRSSAPTRTRR